jgi:hypothetical protein
LELDTVTDKEDLLVKGSLRKDDPIESATLRATLELADEEYAQLCEEKDKILTNYVKDVTKLQEKTKLERIQVKNSEDKVNAFVKMLKDAKEMIQVLETKLSESAKAVDSAKKDYDNRLASLKEAVGKETKSLTETATREVKSIVEQHRKDLLNKYVECRLKFSGLSLSESAQALLEQCKTEDQVEKLIGDYRKALREGLHFSHSGNIVLTETRPIDSKTAAIDKRVGMAFGA